MTKQQLFTELEKYKFSRSYENTKEIINSFEDIPLPRLYSSFSGYSTELNLEWKTENYEVNLKVGSKTLECITSKSSIDGGSFYFESFKDKKSFILGNILTILRG